MRLRLGVGVRVGPAYVGVFGGGRRRKRRPVARKQMDPTRHAMMQPTLRDAIYVARLHRRQKKTLGYR